MVLLFSTIWLNFVAIFTSSGVKSCFSLALESMHYSNLEKKIGVKAGHLLHHLKSLISACYNTKKKRNGSFSQYSITTKGEKALQFLNELRNVFLVAP